MKKKRILVVDDEGSFTRLLKLNLEQTDDYEVKVENGAHQALATACAFKPDLILLDVVMPGLFGSEVAAQLRAEASTRSTPVVLLSAAMGRKRVAENRGQVGGLPFISKPASLEEIVEGIERQFPADSLSPFPASVPSAAVSG